jgi:hypothetical protein
MNRKEVWKKWNEEGIIEKDQDLLQMKYEVVAALEVCRNIPRFNLAADALIQRLIALEGLVNARGIDDEYMPNGDKVLDSIKAPKVKKRKVYNE